MSRVLGSQVGSLDLLDLNVIGEFYGRDSMPYPFRFTQPSRFATKDEADAYTNTVPDRFKHGDLRTFTDCVAAYNAADIRVECHVQYIPASTPCVRMLTYRAGELGFFTEQRPEADVVDVFTVSPYDLGAAVAEALPLTGPGQHQAIVIPEYVPLARAEFDTGPYVIRHAVTSQAQVSVPASEISAYATVQSHWRPPRNWGVDRGKQVLVWVRIIDDGEYVYASDYSHARPLTRSILQERIDELIAEDVEALKEYRADYA
jgi:EspG family